MYELLIKFNNTKTAYTRRNSSITGRVHMKDITN